MSDPETNQPINLIALLNGANTKIVREEVIYIEVLLNKAGTSDCNEADRILSQITELNLNWKEITDITPLSALTNPADLNL